jgi:RNA polymerase sigma factor (sigma-70 family)
VVQNSNTDFDCWTKELIERKARNFSRHVRSNEADVNDISQDLAVAIVLAQKKFNPARGDWRALVTTAARNCILNLRRDRNALKRGKGTWSIDKPLLGEFCLAQMIPEHPINNRPVNPLHEEAVQIMIDVKGALDSLPAELRPLANLLLEYSKAEAARRSGIPRTTLDRRIHQIRRHFEDCGLGVYFE